MAGLCHAHVTRILAAVCTLSYYSKTSLISIPCFSGEMKNARYREVHGIERYVLHVNTAKHGIWGKNTVHGISRNTV